MRRLVIPIIATLMLAGCNKSDGLCSSENSTKSVLGLIQDQLITSLKGSLTNGDPNSNQVVPPSKIREAIQSLAFSITEIRTTGSPGDSSKRNCAGKIAVTFPVDMFNSANSARQALGQNNVNQFADMSDIRSDADKFSTGISYSVQPTDDKASLYSETPGNTPFIKFVAEVVANSLQAQALVQAAQEQKMAEDRLAAQQQADLDAKRKADLALAQTDNRLAIQTIGAVWQSIDPRIRQQLLPEQRAWIAKTRADCRVTAASTSTDPTEIQTAQLACETQANNERTESLKHFVEQQPFPPSN